MGESQLYREWEGHNVWRSYDNTADARYTVYGRVMLLYREWEGHSVWESHDYTENGRVTVYGRITTIQRVGGTQRIG